MTRTKQFRLIFQQNILEVLDLYISDSLIDLICEPLLAVVLHKKCSEWFYRDQYICESPLTHYLILRKIEIEVRSDSVMSCRSDIRNRCCRVKDIMDDRLSYVTIDGGLSYAMKFIFPESKYNIVLTDYDNKIIYLDDSGCVQKQSLTAISSASKLTKFILYPTVRLFNLKIHYDTYDTYDTYNTCIVYQRPTPVPHICMSCFVYDVVVENDDGRLILTKGI